MLYHELSAIYYDINNEPNKALVEINKALGFFKKDEQPYYRAQLETKKGEYLSRLELYAEAIYAYENALMTNDFLNTEMLKNQEKIYKENYKIEQALLKKESHKTYFHIFLLILLIILFVFAILFLKKYIFLTKNLSRSRKNIINAKNEAEEANHLQTEFLNYVRNQLNTPLSVVVSNSRILTKNNDISDTERINLSSQIENNSCILIDIGNSVLELSRLESGKIIFNIRKYDLISLCNEIGRAHV